MAAFKTFKSAGVLVFANSRKDSAALPPGVSQLREKQGKFIPILYALTPDGSKGIDVVPYEVLKEDARKAARNLKKKIASTDLSTTANDEEQPKQPTAKKLLAKEQAWTNSSGKTINAAVISADKNTVEFLINNKPVSYPLNKLSAESQKKITELTQQNP